MWFKWLPWRLVIRQVAKARGFIDPIAVLSRLHNFSQPSEVREPVELLRAGVVLHARGLINTQAIQHNLDWVWPYWVERQFNPHDVSFVPRAFSITHVNLTHRNWTPVGIPECDAYPIVDPAGLVTPLHDGWSIDFWVLPNEGEQLFPSRQESRIQQLGIIDRLSVSTETRIAGASLRVSASVIESNGEVLCSVVARADAENGGKLIMNIRPYNPEGVSFIHKLSFESRMNVWKVNGVDSIILTDRPEGVFCSRYQEGDVLAKILADERADSTVCDVGMATGAAVYSLPKVGEREVSLTVPVREEQRAPRPRKSWGEIFENETILRIPDERMHRLFRSALRTLVLLTPHEIYPGPYTYKRFWFRDAAFMLYPLICLGFFEQAEGVIETFFRRQKRNGYFLSQEGEWDSNGEVLWILDAFCAYSNFAPRKHWVDPIKRGAEWIIRKRCSDPGKPHDGLLPAGFSAEHLGSNDYYYWDNYFSVAGLFSTARLMDRVGCTADAELYRSEGRAFMRGIERSIGELSHPNQWGAIPASPYRRMDSGAIGTIVGSYPLALVDPQDPRMKATGEYLHHECTVHGGFFQDMIHSGINPYLSLHLAQHFLRIGDPRCHDLVTNVANLASPTGHWPEAVHPHTLGGCMGDGAHGWAAAEWVMIMRNYFVREERDKLILLSGIHPSWIAEGKPCSFGPTYTASGAVKVSITAEGAQAVVSWDVSRGTTPIRIQPIGYVPLETAERRGTVRLTKESR